MIAKRFYTRMGLALLLPLAAACQQGENEAPEAPAPKGPLSVEASVEVPEGYQDTKVFMDADAHIFWNAGDQISFFPKTTQNCAFTFQGTDGSKSGSFSAIYPEDDTAQAVDRYYAAYPYRDDNSLSTAGVLTLSLPAAQVYQAGSFDPQAQLMAAVSISTSIGFKNVCCVVGFQLYGAGVEVCSLSLRGNSGEILAGPMTVTPGDEPAYAFTAAASATEITLTAATPVVLDATTPTLFWMVVPPLPFHDGFTLTVTAPDGKTFEKTSHKDITLVRNHAHRMAALEVVFAAPVPTAEGFYLDGSEPYQFSAATDQVNLYEAEGSIWARIITPSTLTVREIGPIPVSPVVGESFDASYTLTIAGVASPERACRLTVLSLDNGILTLEADDHSYFVFRL